MVDIINSHSYGEEQTSVEAEMLYDADKLEYLSVERLREATEGLAPERLLYYKNEWRRRMLGEGGVPVYDTLHFKISRQMFRERLTNIYDKHSEDPVWGDVVREVGEKLL